MSKVPTFQWGGRVANAPPDARLPGLAQHQLDARLRHQPDQDHAAATPSRPGSTRRTATRPSRSATHGASARSTSSRTRSAPTRSTPRSGSRTRRSAPSARSSRRSATSRRRRSTATSTSTSQDNWKVNNRLTLDYGMRFVHQGAQYDQPRPGLELPARAVVGGRRRRRLYVAGCRAASPCTGNNRVAVNPLTGQSLGAGSVGRHWHARSRYRRSPERARCCPAATSRRPPTSSRRSAFGPRFGAAYDLSGKQSLIVRGGVGLFFDRPFTTALSGWRQQSADRRPSVTAQYAQLQTLGGGGPEHRRRAGADGGQLSTPSCRRRAQWNVGTQAALPWATTVDVAYVGSHGYDLLQQVNINAIDFGAAFLPQNQDADADRARRRALPSSRTTRCGRIRGYGNINLFWNRGWRTYHSLQLSFQRRFQNGAGVRLQRHHRPVGPAAGRRPSAAQRRRRLLASAPIRPRPTSCSATTTRSATSCAPTSSGTCRTSGAAQSAAGRRSASWSTTGRSRASGRVRAAAPTSRPATRTCRAAPTPSGSATPTAAATRT